MPGGLSALSSVRVSLGLTIGTLAADFQDSKRRLQPLRLEGRQSGARHHQESRANLFHERGPEVLGRDALPREPRRDVR